MLAISRSEDETSLRGTASDGHGERAREKPYLDGRGMPARAPARADCIHLLRLLLGWPPRKRGRIVPAHTTTRAAGQASFFTA